MRPHQVGAERAVEADGERFDVGEGIPQRFDLLRGDHGFPAQSDGGGDDDGQVMTVFREDFLDADHGGLGIERVENRLHHEDVAASLDERADLVFIGRKHLIEGHHAEAGIIRIRRVGQGNGERADGSGDVALAPGVAADVVRPFPAEAGGFDVHFPREVVEEGVLKDFLEELGILAPAFFPRVFDKEFALRDAGRGEGVGLANVGTGFVKALVDVADDVGPGDRKDVAVVQQILLVASVALAASLRFIEAVAADSGAHRAVEHEDSLRESVLEFGGEVGLRHDGTLACCRPNSRIKSSYQDMKMGYRQDVLALDQAKSPLTTLAGSTPVRRWSRPWNLKFRRSCSRPRAWSMVAWRSRMCTGSLTIL